MWVHIRPLFVKRQPWPVTVYCVNTNPYVGCIDCVNWYRINRLSSLEYSSEIRRKAYREIRVLYLRKRNRTKRNGLPPRTVLVSVRIKTGKRTNSPSCLLLQQRKRGRHCYCGNCDETSVVQLAGRCLGQTDWLLPGGIRTIGYVFIEKRHKRLLIEPQVNIEKWVQGDCVWFVVDCRSLEYDRIGCWLLVRTIDGRKQRKQGRNSWFCCYDERTKRESFANPWKIRLLSGSVWLLSINNHFTPWRV